MRNIVLFIGIFLIITGGLLLLNQLGYLDQWGINLGAILLPVFLILIGIWVLVSVFFNRGQEKIEQLVIQREGTKQAEIRINYGAGRIKIGASDQVENLLEAKFGGGVSVKDSTTGDPRTISLRTPDNAFWIFPMNTGFNWDINLCSEIPINLDIKTGAGESFLDLEKLNISDLRIQTGAGATQVILPSHPGLLRSKIQTGVGELILTVPPGVPVRFNASVGLGEIKRDRNRFMKVGHYYQTENFDQAQDKIDITITTGLGSVSIR
jgi:hypothetical protein